MTNPEHPNRREFLVVGAMGLAGSMAPAADNLRTRIRTGFLGVAYSHAEEKIRLVRESKELELVGVCDEDPVLRDKYAARGISVLAEASLLERAEVVVVESSVQKHAEFARRALMAGRQVHLEKPPAERMSEFEELLELARSRRRLLQVGYMWRHNPGLNALLDLVRKGWLGDVHFVRGTLNTTPDPRRREEWSQFKGGVLFELGSHLVDFVVRLMGSPEGVTSFLKTHGSSTDSFQDNTVAVLEYPRVTAVLCCSALQPNASEHRSVEVVGTHGTARVQPLEQPVLEVDLVATAGPYARGKHRVTFPRYQRYEGEFVELAKCIREGTELPVTLEMEKQVQETLLRVCRALPP